MTGIQAGTSPTAREGSDLHLKIPSPPLVRLHGELQPIPGFVPFGSAR